jgi:hypothetical protein
VKVRGIALKGALVNELKAEAEFAFKIQHTNILRVYVTPFLPPYFQPSFSAAMASSSIIWASRKLNAVLEHTAIPPRLIVS